MDTPMGTHSKIPKSSYLTNPIQSVQRRFFNNVVHTINTMGWAFIHAWYKGKNTMVGVCDGEGCLQRGRRSDDIDDVAN